MNAIEAKEIVLRKFPRAEVYDTGISWRTIKTRGRGLGYLCSGRTEGEAWIASAMTVKKKYPEVMTSDLMHLVNLVRECDNG